MTQLFAEFNDPTKRVLVISDLEPDDYLAIFMLAATTKCQLTFIASCWTNPAEKAAILRKLLNDAGSNAPVYHGIPSDKVYDLGKLRVLLGMNDLPAEPPAYTAALIEAADVIISLAPPQELIAAHAANPAVFEGKKAAFYGSFNIRWGVGKGLYTREAVLAMIQSFRSVVWHETFFARGQNNTISHNAVLERITAQFPAMKALTKWWNDAIYAECAAENPQSDLDRKIMASIDAAPNQMVDADCGLLAYLLHGNPYMTLDPVDLAFTDRFTALTDNPASSIRVIRTAPDAFDSSRLHTYAFYSHVRPTNSTGPAGSTQHEVAPSAALDGDAAMSNL